ncbi:RnfH family protein [Luteimonas yindakuii]|uniref:RnfH family protein n=1 Tax=Luteimonas yindakuii TaxID=2565782 RepID=UPI00140BD749|nr:RnfH family protein [Luteimonas yindakuii]
MSAGTIRVRVVLAWPRRFEEVELRLPAGARVADAIASSGLPLEGIDGQAVFGERVDTGALLNDGDRIELLRPLVADPKDARRRRASERLQQK